MVLTLFTLLLIFVSPFPVIFRRDTYCSGTNPRRIRQDFQEKSGPDTVSSRIIPSNGMIRNSMDPIRYFPARNTAPIFRIFFRTFPMGSMREPTGMDRKKHRFRQVPAGSGGRNHRPGLFSSVVSLC